MKFKLLFGVEYSLKLPYDFGDSSRYADWIYFVVCRDIKPIKFNLLYLGGNDDYAP